MALMTSYTEPEEAAEVVWYTVTERLALTEDDRIVPEESTEARWLYAIPGRRIPIAEAVRYGLAAGNGKASAATASPPNLAVSAEADVPIDPPVSTPEPVKRPRGRPRKVRE